MTPICRTLRHIFLSGTRGWFLLLLVFQILLVAGYIQTTLYPGEAWGLRLQHNRFIGDEPSYLLFRFSSPQSIFDTIRSPGLPLFLRLYDVFFDGYQYWPYFQFVLFVSSILFLFWSLTRFGFAPFPAFLIASLLLWNTPVYALVLRDLYTEMLYLSFLNFTLATLLLSVQHARWTRCVFFAASLFFLYQIRPNGSYVSLLAPVWAVGFSAVNTGFHIRPLARVFSRFVLLSLVPLFLLGLVRLFVLGHFSFSTMTGGTLAGHATHFLNEQNVLRLSGETRVIGDAILQRKRQLGFPCGTSPFSSPILPPGQRAIEAQASCFGPDLITAWHVAIKYQTGNEPFDDPEKNIEPWRHDPDSLSAFHFQNYHSSTDSILLKFSKEILILEWQRYLAWIWQGGVWGIAYLFYNRTVTFLSVLCVISALFFRFLMKKGYLACRHTTVWTRQVVAFTLVAVSNFAVGYLLLLLFNFPFHRMYLPLTPYLFPALVLWAIPPLGLKKHPARPEGQERNKRAFLSSRIRTMLYPLSYFLLANILFFLSNVPLFVLSGRTPAGSVFSFNHISPLYDYNVYLSVITQGATGDWLMRDAFTHEPTHPSLFYFFYILVGKFAHLFSFPSFVVYHVARVFSAELFILSLWFFSSFLFLRRAAFWFGIFAVFGTISPLWFFGTPDAFVTFFPWWGNLEALGRMNAMPHYLFGYSLLFLSFRFIFSFFRHPSSRSLFLTLLSVFSGGILFPPSLLPIVFSLPLSLLLTRFPPSRPFLSFSFSCQKTVGFLLIFSVAMLSLLLIWRENQNGFPWDAWNQWEIATWNIRESGFNRALLFSFGILPLLSIPAILSIFSSRNWEHASLLFWAFLPFLLLPVIPILGISKFRLISTAPFVPLSFLTTLTLFSWRPVSGRFRLRVFLIVIFFLTTLPVFLERFSSTFRGANRVQMYSNVFLSQDTWNTLVFIRRNVPKNSVILSDEFMGNVIPAHAPTLSYFGHGVHTKDFFAKQAAVGRFYAEQMNPGDARNFLSASGISYVLFSDDEKRHSDGRLDYPFLVAVSTTPSVTLYRVTL